MTEHSEQARSHFVIKAIKSLLIMLVLLVAGWKPDSGSRGVPANDLDRARVEALRFAKEHIDSKNGRMEAQWPSKIRSVFSAHGIKLDFWLLTDRTANLRWIMESDQISDPTSQRYHGQNLGIRSDGTIVSLRHEEWRELMKEAKPLDIALPAPNDK